MNAFFNKLFKRVVQGMPDPLFIGILGVLAALLSVGIQGFSFGISNNIFHIPFVLKLASQPQFADDQFYASLRNFTSMVWPLLGMVSTEENVKTVFFVAHIISRSLAMVAVVITLRCAGVISRPFLVAAMILLSSTPMFMGESYIGKSGLFVNYFTHSECTHPFFLLFMVTCVKKQVRLMWLCAGLIFGINAFMGFWAAFMAGAMTVFFLIPSSEPRRRVLLKATLQGCALALLPVAPVLIWIARTIIGSGGALPFDFLEFVKFYFPHHFIVVDKQPLVTVFLMTAATMLALVRERFTTRWSMVVIAITVLLLTGMLLPYVTHHRLLLNLQLLRTDAVMQLYCVVILIASALRSGEPGEGRVPFNCAISLIALASAQWPFIFMVQLFQSLDVKYRKHTTLFAYGIVAFAVLLAAADFAGLRNLTGGDSKYGLISLFAALYLSMVNYRRIQACILWVPAAVVIALVVVNGQAIPMHVCSAMLCLFIVHLVNVGRGAGKPHFSVALLPVWTVLFILIPAMLYAHVDHRKDALPTEAERDWREMAGWVRAHGISGPVLIPPRNLGEGRMRFDDFQLAARVPVWVDWKQGAAVMWQPSFYRQWYGRIKDVGRLSSFDEWYGYARTHGIPVFVVKASLVPEQVGGKVLFSNRTFALCEGRDHAQSSR